MNRMSMGYKRVLFSGSVFWTSSAVGPCCGDVHCSPSIRLSPEGELGFLSEAGPAKSASQQLVHTVLWKKAEDGLCCRGGLTMLRAQRTWLYGCFGSGGANSKEREKWQVLKTGPQIKYSVDPHTRTSRQGLPYDVMVICSREALKQLSISGRNDKHSFLASWPP